jgi:feruloyl esterase
MGVEYEQVVNGCIHRFRAFRGMFHCGGGVGTSQFDPATPVVNWVEAGKAPERIEATRVVAGKAVRTRPLCAYPLVARYRGTGSIDETSSFSCVKP